MLITSFSAGQLSKKLYGRIDLPVYVQGASELTNFNIVPTGGIERRRGTKRIGQLKQECRLISFIINQDVSFILEIGSRYIRIWKDNELIKIGGVPLEFLDSTGTPLYASVAEIREVQFSQMYDSIYLVHRSYPVYKLSWEGGNSFTLTRISFISNEGRLPFSDSGRYPGTIAFFQGRLFLGGTIEEPQKVWASQPFEYLDFTYFDTITTTATKLKNPDIHVFSASLTVDSTTLKGVSQDISTLANLTDYYVSGVGIPIGTKLLSATSDTLVLSNAASTTGIDFTCTIQLWKTPGNPEAVDYEDITISNDVTGAGHAFYFEVASDKNDAIKWMAPQRDLIIGTESSEFVVLGSSNALGVQVVPNSRTGSAPLQATMVGSSILFFATGARSMKEYYYQYEQEAYRSSNLALWCEEALSESPALDFDYASAPHSKVFVTRQDGAVFALLYEKDLGVMGWSKIALSSGLVTSTAIISTENGFDTVYFAVKAGGAYYLEALSDANLSYLDGHSDWDNTVNTAQYPLIKDAEAVVFDTVTHEVYQLGSIPVGFGLGHEVQIGYPFESKMRSMPVVNDGENSLKRIVRLKIRFHESYMPRIINAQGNEEHPTAVEPFSGVYNVPFTGSFDTDVFFSLCSDSPHPLSVLSVYAELT